MGYSFEQTWKGYAYLWDTAKINAPSPVHLSANMIANGKAIYQQVEAATGVSWWWIGCAHYRESTCDFRTYLGNGQSLKEVTTIVPKGRGPFENFVDGAVDALIIQGLKHIVETWSLEYALYEWELFNGQGYFGKCNSPYLWSGTDVYTAGKYDRDGHFDASLRDPQMGCAAILKALISAGALAMPPRERDLHAAASSPVMPATKEASPMATQAPVSANPNVIATGAPTLGATSSVFTSLEHVAEFALPLVAGFVPEVKPFVPVTEAVLKMGGAILAANGDPSAILAAIENALAPIEAAVKQVIAPA